MRGVIYARYSSHAQREESIEQQIEECRKFAEREGISIVDIYADKAVTGRTDKRREFQRLLRDADKKQTISDCESELASLENQKLYTRDQIIFALGKFKSESLNSERYMRVILQKFVKAVYLFDDGGLRLECYYGDGIYLHSPHVDTAPPYVLRSNIVVFADWFSICI